MQGARRQAGSAAAQEGARATLGAGMLGGRRRAGASACSHRATAGGSPTAAGGYARTYKLAECEGHPARALRCRGRAGQGSRGRRWGVGRTGQAGGQAVCLRWAAACHGRHTAARWAGSAAACACKVRAAAHRQRRRTPWPRFAASGTSECTAGRGSGSQPASLRACIQRCAQGCCWRCWEGEPGHTWCTQPATQVRAAHASRAASGRGARAVRGAQSCRPCPPPPPHTCIPAAPHLVQAQRAGAVWVKLVDQRLQRRDVQHKACGGRAPRGSPLGALPAAPPCPAGAVPCAAAQARCATHGRPGRWGSPSR